MKNSYRKFSGCLFMLIIATATLTGGCGGGGGGSGGVASGTLQITPNNAVQVSAQSAYVSGVMDSTGANAGGITAQNLRQKAPRINLAALISGHVARLGGALPPMRAASNRVMPSALPAPELIGCSVSGTILITVLSSSSAVVSFTNCVDSASSGIANGIMVLSALSFSDVNFVPPWNVSANVKMNDFTVDDGVHVVVLNGSTHLTDSMKVDGITETYTLSGGPLVLDVDGHNSTLSGFSVSLVEDQNTLAYSTSLNGTLATDQLRGDVVLDTLTPFSGINIDLDNPLSGSMVVRGAAHSTLKLTAIGNGQVRLEVDADGDGAVDAGGTSITTWTALEAALL